MDPVTRLLTQYQTATNLKAIVSAFGSIEAAREAALSDAITKRMLATATDEQLDEYGALLNVPRGGLTDDQFRAALYLKIYENFSEGTVENLIQIFGTVLGQAYGLSLGEMIVTLNEYQPATISMQVNFGGGDFAPPADLENALINARIAVEQCKIAGVGIGLLSYSTHFTGEPPFGFFEDLRGDALGFDDGTQTLGGVFAAAF